MKKYFIYIINVVLLLSVLLTVCSFRTYAADASFDSRVVRMGFIALKDNAEVDDDGVFSGINVENAYKIGQYANLNIDIILFPTGQEALTMLDEGKIDMMCNVIKTPDREGRYLFSEYEVGNVPMCVFVRRNDDRFSFGNTQQLTGCPLVLKKTARSEPFLPASAPITGLCQTYRFFQT